MALPTNLSNLDTERFGLPFVGWTAPSLAASKTLDNEVYGTPHYLQDEQIVISAASITFTPNAVKAVTSNREYPNRTIESTWESQVKQIVPYVPIQYPLT